MRPTCAKIVTALSSAAACLGLVATAPSLLPRHSPESRSSVFANTFYEPDPELIVRLKPGLRSSFRSTKLGCADSIHTNSDGFRGPDFAEPDVAALRIMVLGDSISFGFGVREEAAWPIVLAQLLRERFPDKRIQVRNLSVPGYSTYQGTLLIKQHLEGGYDPDVIFFCFGFNDGYLRAHTDHDLAELRKHDIRLFLKHSAPFLGLHLLLDALCPAAASVPTTVRVPPERLRSNLDEVIELCRDRGVSVILGDFSLPNMYPRRAFRAAATHHSVKLVELREVFAKYVAHVNPPLSVSNELVRIEVAGTAFPPSQLLPATAGAQLLILDDPEQRLNYRVIPLLDDGTKGDSVPGDSIYTASFVANTGSSPEYCIWLPALASHLPEMRDPTSLLSAMQFFWLSMDNFRNQAPLVPPWGSLLLMPDIIHPNEKGAALIAETMLHEALDLPEVRALLETKLTSDERLPSARVSLRDPMATRQGQ